MKKILIIGTGGTIGAVSEDEIRLGNPLKILELYKNDDVVFDSAVPFKIFSENVDIDFWQKLVHYIGQIDFEEYEGIILLHGSDTLAFTGAILANIFYDKKIVLVAANKPLDNKNSNGLANFDRAVNHILNAKYNNVFVSYDGLYPAYSLESAKSNDEFSSINVDFTPIENPVLKDKKIIIVNPYPSIDYNSIKVDGANAVLHTMYHSATASEKVMAFINRCKNKNIPFYFVTSKSSAPYETAKEFDNIIFSSTLENAYARLLLDDKI